jgi:oligoendopeptidase F
MLPLHINPPHAATKSGAAADVDAKLGPMPVWNLADLYASPSAPEIARDKAAAAKTAADIKARYQGKLKALGSDGAKLAEAIKAYENLADQLGRLGAYAGLLRAGDLANPDYGKFYGDTSEALTNISTDLIFFELELNQIDDVALEKALKVPALAKYRPWLSDLRKEKPHQLDEKLEQLFQEKGQTGAGAMNRLFDDTLTALRFKVAGEPEPLTLEPTLNLLSNTDRTKRKAASDALVATFKDIADSRHLANRVEAPVVAALEASVTAAYPRLSHRYYTMKAKWLGLEKLMHWDRNAPLPDQPDRDIPWEDARKMVLDAYNGFAPEMGQIAGQFFDKRWIDAPHRPGKASGAFAHPTVPTAHPYVLLNYKGKSRDVMTLAHELGHGVHQVLANGQGLLLASTPLTLAETASVFGEMLTFRALLAQTTDKKQRKALLAGKVEDMLNTVVRQIAFYKFERKIHTARREGELTSDQINALWMSIQAESLGPSIEFGPGYETFWVYIGHFIRSPFYVYAYAFGDCLVNSLYGLYQEAHPGFVGKYFDLLKAGGSKHHKELLAPFGLNAADPAFWNKGLNVIAGLIDELETME